jgi:hypothetical protein
MADRARAGTRPPRPPGIDPRDDSADIGVEARLAPGVLLHAALDGRGVEQRREVAELWNFFVDFLIFCESLSFSFRFSFFPFLPLTFEICPCLPKS